MDKGVDWEKALIAASPEFEANARQGKFQGAVLVVGPEGIGAMYWYASCLGKWAKRTGFAVLLGQKDNIKATMTHVLERSDLLSRRTSPLRRVLLDRAGLRRR